MRTYDVGVSFLIISENFSGQRIDNFLCVYLKKVPKSVIYRIIRTGKVRINKKRIKFQYRLKIGDLLKIPAITSVNIPQPVNYDRKRVLFLKNIVIYEDNYLLVLNKPSGIIVHKGGINHRDQLNIIDGLKVLYPKTQFLKLVHRLDRDTSGILLIAKNRIALTYLHEQLRSQKIKKEYLALVCGSWNNYVHFESVPLLKSQSYSKNNNVVFVDFKNGKLSKTCFRIKERFRDIATLLKVELITGRSHQIRVHTQYNTHPIIGDKIYGNNKINTKFKKLGLSRLFLHAFELCFVHPFTHKRLCVYAPLDKDFNRCLFLLRRNIIY